MSVILATAGQDDKIRFWEAPSGVCSRILRYADSQVNCLEITPDKQYLAAGGNPHIRLFEINNASNQSILTLEGHTGNVTSLGFQRNGRYLYSSSEDGTVRIIIIIFEHTHHVGCNVCSAWTTNLVIYCMRWFFLIGYRVSDIYSFSTQWILTASIA